MNATKQGIEMRAKIKQAIISYMEKHGYAPTIREIGDMVGLSSTSSVHNHLIRMIARKEQYLSACVAEDGCVISQLRTWSKRLRFLAVANSVLRCTHSERLLLRGNIGGQKMCFLYRKD